jgi:hypothetical protein
MKKNEFTFEITVPEHFDGKMDIRVGFHKGRITGKPQILNAQLFLNDATIKVREAGEQRPT